MDADSLQPSVYDALQPIQTSRLRELLRTSPLSALEMFHPKVVQQICLLWGSPEMNTYFSRITMDASFTQTTKLNAAEIDELLFLGGVHGELFPRPDDVWTKSHRY